MTKRQKIIGGLLAIILAFSSLSLFKKKDISIAPKVETVSEASMPASAEKELPEANLIDRLFATDSSQLPIVETITYTSRVPWMEGRPAWIADYSSYYSTSRHFIARSLNHKPDYFTQKISPGDQFTVFRKDQELQFYLLIDLSRCKMWFYALQNQKPLLLKTYSVGLGRKDGNKTSGYLTPVGKYTLGSKIAIYRPGSMGYFQDQQTEMIRVFGTRWIPFETEIGATSEPAKGFGIHGSPWKTGENGELIEDRGHISKYDSDGCIRLNAEDIEELFSIIITKPTTVELVKDFHESALFKDFR